jgi:hypothetical protein
MESEIIKQILIKTAEVLSRRYKIQESEKIFVPPNSLKITRNFTLGAIK